MRKKKSTIFLFKKGKKNNRKKIFNFSNPQIFYRKKKNIHEINFMYILYVFLIIIIGFLSFFFLRGTFNIKSINVILKDNISNIDIAYNYLDNIRGESIFFIKKSNIEKKLKKYQENLNFVKIEKQFPDKLRIEIGSYKSIFNTTINNKNYIITSNGTLVPGQHSAKLINFQLMGNLKSNSSFIIPDYKRILSEKNIKQIIYIYRQIKENIMGIKINYLSYYPIEREIHFSINNNILLIFDLTKNLEKQIKNLTIFNSTYFKLTKESLVYIDLRIDNKIFYCDKENKHKCNLNLDSLYKK